jgi:hypothetical protein
MAIIKNLHKKIKRIKSVASSASLFALALIAKLSGRWPCRTCSVSTCWIIATISTPMPGIFTLLLAIFYQFITSLYLCDRLYHLSLFNFIQ